jgi:hemin uptake protein HemP
MQERDGASRAPGEGSSVDRTGAVTGGSIRRLTSAELLAGAKEVVIEHEKELYRLRCTSKGKLILTK